MQEGSALESMQLKADGVFSRVRCVLVKKWGRHLSIGLSYQLPIVAVSISGFEADDANDLYQILLEVFGERKIFFIDEVQNVTGWEHFVRRFMDMGFKFYITGSNASLLSKELGTRLTGRYVPIELFPFSFKEYLEFRQEEIPDLTRMTTVQHARLQSLLQAYLESGGIPDVLKYPELPLLRTLYDDVLYRDIATRYRLDDVTAICELAFFLISNPTSLISFNKLKDQLRLGSVTTIKNYISYMENSWLVFTLKLFAVFGKLRHWNYKVARRSSFSFQTWIS